jgi:hypothetical protein
VPGVVVDTGPLIALFDGSDRHHAVAVAFLEQNREPLITNLAVITETTVVICPRTSPTPRLSPNANGSASSALATLDQDFDVSRTRDRKRLANAFPAR